MQTEDKRSARARGVQRGSVAPGKAEARRREGGLLTQNTPEAFEARSRGGRNGTRRGVPDGQGGRRQEIEATVQAAHERALDIVSRCRSVENGYEADPGGEEAAREALARPLAIVIAGVDRPDIMLKASRTVLDFVLSKPAQRSEVSVGGIDGYLQELLDREAQKKEAARLIEGDLEIIDLPVED
jgi:hypothetical protein